MEHSESPPAPASPPGWARWGRPVLVVAGVLMLAVIVGVVAGFLSRGSQDPVAVSLQITDVRSDGWDAWVMGESSGLPDGALVRAKLSAPTCRAAVEECMAEGWAAVTGNRWMVRMPRQHVWTEDGAVRVLVQFSPQTGDAMVTQPQHVVDTFGALGERIAAGPGVADWGPARVVVAGKDQPALRD